MSSCITCGQPAPKGSLYVEDPRDLYIANNVAGDFTITYSYIAFTGTTIPDTIKWSGDIIYPLTIINQTADELVLASGYYYIDNEGNQQTTIPANSTVQIKKSNQGTFEQVGGGSGSGGGGSLTGNL